MSADEAAGTDRPRQTEPAIDTSVPHSARVWNYWLGGKDNYPVDRALGEEIKKVFPGMPQLATSTRAFLVRAVTHLTQEEGVRQFLDVGTGLPTGNNTHEVAQALAPETDVVYVDHDPLVLAHARALLTSTTVGTTEYIEADLRDTDTILAEARERLDFDRPVALILSGILGHVQDHAEACTLVRHLMAGLPAGSYLVSGDGTHVHGSGAADAEDEYTESGAIPYITRTPRQIEAYFEGLELVEPGVVTVSRWKHEETEFGLPPEVDGYGGVGRKL